MKDGECTWIAYSKHNILVIQIERLGQKWWHSVRRVKPNMHNPNKMFKAKNYQQWPSELVNWKAFFFHTTRKPSELKKKTKAL